MSNNNIWRQVTVVFLARGIHVYLYCTPYGRGALRARCTLWNRLPPIGAQSQSSTNHTIGHVKNHWFWFMC